MMSYCSCTIYSRKKANHNLCTICVQTHAKNVPSAIVFIGVIFYVVTVLHDCPLVSFTATKATYGSSDCSSLFLLFLRLSATAILELLASATTLNVTRTRMGKCAVVSLDLLSCTYSSPPPPSPLLLPHPPSYVCASHSCAVEASWRSYNIL